jgi:hypothetical protein
VVLESTMLTAPLNTTSVRSTCSTWNAAQIQRHKQGDLPVKL